MARINKQLLERLQRKLGVGQSRVYALIDEKVSSAHLPRHLAAIAVASERGISISKFATADDLAAIRQTAISAVPPPVVIHQEAASLSGSRKSRKKIKPAAHTQQRRGTTVFVVHGRNLEARDSVFSFLRSIGLRPLEWTQALRLTKKGSPYVGEILDAAFREAAAILVLLTPDDEARLNPAFATSGDPSYERQLTGQARPNVLFEAGMAFGKDPNSTILVQLGNTRPFSDVGGRHVLHLSNNPDSRLELVTKLANAGCNVDTTGTDWLKAGNFQQALASRSSRTIRKRKTN
jgi:predicted nucleotide-binding protein